jgi:HSP20 family protein
MTMPLLMRPLNEVSEQMERLFHDLTEELSYPMSNRTDWKSLKAEINGAKAWIPPVEISETKTDFIIKSQLPGIKSDDVQIEILENTVLISGETQQEKKEDKHDFHRSEFRYGRFCRQIQLPRYVNADEGYAEFNKGILELYFPKVDENKRKCLKINVGKVNP